MGRLPSHRFPVSLAVRSASLRCGAKLSWKTFARVIDMDSRQLGRCRRDGGFTPFTADRVAVSLGFHPVEIWPEWFDVALAEMAPA